MFQRNEVKNSGAMELEGLKRCFQSLHDNNVTVAELTTDRHTQVKKYMKVEQSEIRHQFDVWHMAKGVRKKLEKLGRMTGLEAVGRWSRSIANHMYWCAATSGGNGPLVQEKWLSLLNHICNIHQHQGPLFGESKHGEIEDREWLTPGSRAVKNIESGIAKKPFLKDLQKLASAEQTSALESFHNIICLFAPKHEHFFYTAMKSRIIIAALHFNENSKRPQSSTKAGDLKYGVTYSKANGGIPIIKEIKEPITYGYVRNLMETVMERRRQLPTYKKALKEIAIETPPTVSDSYTKIEKATVIERHTSRFQAKNC